MSDGEYFDNQKRMRDNKGNSEESELQSSQRRWKTLKMTRAQIQQTVEELTRKGRGRKKENKEGHGHAHQN